MKKYLILLLPLIFIFYFFQPSSALAITCTSSLSPDTISANTNTKIKATYTVPTNGGWYFPKPPSITNVGALNDIAYFSPVPGDPNFLELYPWEDTYPNTAGTYMLEFNANIANSENIEMDILNTQSTAYICKLVNTLKIESTTSPTPTPLLVPSIKQTNPIWKSQTYDNAKKWSQTDPSIGTWGCSLTSATMILNYYNILKLPDSSFITPGTLNKWLNSQKDGYLGNGNINWLAISRLSKIAKKSGYNPNFSHDALEFQKVTGNNINQLTTDIQNGQPDILEEPGHFIVAKGKKDSTFLINDPFYSYTTLAEGYNNSFISLNRFIPSNTDLSYVLIVGNELNNLHFNDSNNNSLGETFIQDPLVNDNNSSQRAGDLTRELLLKNPSTGNYTLEISSVTDTFYTFDIFLYDKDGNPFVQSVSGLTSNGSPDYIEISYNHEDKDSSGAQKVIDFDSVVKDINESISLRKIDRTLGNSLITLLNSAKKSSSKNKTLAKTTIKTVQTIIKSSKPILVSKDTYQVLNDDLSFLLKHI